MFACLCLLLGRGYGEPQQLLQNSAVWTDSKHLPLLLHSHHSPPTYSTTVASSS